MAMYVKPITETAIRAYGQTHAMYFRSGTRAHLMSLFALLKYSP